MRPAEAPLIRGRYRLVQHLGRGGAGSVYLVEDRCLHDARLALKAMFLGAPDSERPAQALAERRLVEILREEFRVLAALAHPRLARVYDFGRLPPGSSWPGSEGRAGYFLTRDYLQGRDLRNACVGRVMVEILQFVAEASDALAVLHAAGLIHGDLKPENVIVTLEDRVHLIDFGLARAEGQAGVTAGTLAYLAPEVFLSRPSDRRTDLYALGIMLSELLMGQLPFAATVGSEIIEWHLEAPPPRLPESLAAPPELDALVTRLCCRDPKGRDASAREVAIALRRIAKALVPTGRGLVRHASIVDTPMASAQDRPLPMCRSAVSRALRTLEEGLSRRSQGLGGAALIEVMGEAGAGKTTLVREFAWRAQIAGVEVVSVRACPDDARPYGSLHEALDQIASLTLRPHPFAQERDGGLADASRFAAHEAVASYFRFAADLSPLCVVIEDIEHADEATRALLRFIARRAPAEVRMLFVVSYRLGSCAAKGRLGGCRVELSPLRAGDVEQMLKDAGGPDDARLAAHVAEHTGGNPRFVCEVLRALEAAHWPRRADLTTLAAPRSLEAALLADYAALEHSDAGSVAEALSTLARPALADEIVALSGSTARRGLAALEGLGLVTRHAIERYALCRGAFAAFVYARIPEERRRKLHRAAARWLDTAKGEGIASESEVLHHLIRGGDLKAVLERGLAAAEALFAMHAHEPALQLYRGMLEILPAKRWGDPVGTSLRQRIAALERLVGSSDQAIDMLEALRKEADARVRIQAEVDLGALLVEIGQLDKAQVVLESVWRSGAETKHRVAACRELASVSMRRGDQRAAIALLDEGLALLPGDESGASERALLLAARGLARAYLTEFQSASRDFTAGLENARKASDRRAELSCLSSAAASAFRQGASAESTRLYEAALATAQDMHDVERIATMRMNLSILGFHRGDFRASQLHLPESLRLFQAAGLEQRAATARSNLGQLYLELGAFEQARLELVGAREEFELLGAHHTVARVDVLLAILNARQDRIAESRLLFASALETVDRLGLAREGSEYALDRLQIELDWSDDVPAADLLEAAEERSSRVDAEDHRARLWVLRARCVARVGERDEVERAQGEILQALEFARKQTNRDLEWQAHAAAGELAHRRGHLRDAVRHYAAAAAILEALAASLDAETRATFFRDPRRQGVLAKAKASLPEAPTEPDALDRAHRIDDRFYRLLEINRELNSEHDPARLQERIMDAAVELTGAERGFLVIWTDAQPVIEIARNLDRETLDSEAGNYSRSIADKVFASGEPLITVSAQNDPRFDEYLSVHALQLESVLCIPVRVRGKTVGVLYMESRFHRGRFGHEDQRILLAFGDQVAISLENARLMAENRARTEALTRANGELEKQRAEIATLYDERGKLLDRRTRELHTAERDLEETRRRLQHRVGAFGLVGGSAPMQRLFSIMERLSNTDVPVLIEGESGTGKEMVARGIHNQSRRKDKPIISLNCAAIPESLLESELFGHVKGAFTGADRERVGLFQAAHGGTLFLDEIGDTPQRMQVDLLRALQEKTIRRVGSSRDTPVDVRIIAATNKPLADLVAAQRFREDLYYRLNVVAVRLPPLRERKEDVPLLVEHFLGVIATRMNAAKRTVSRAAMKVLMDYPWPGNVRQLEHMLMNAWIMAESELIDVPDLAIAKVEEPAPDLHGREAERHKILAALEQAGWNKTKASDLLQMPRRTFYRRLREYDIE